VDKMLTCYLTDGNGYQCTAFRSRRTIVGPRRRFCCWFGPCLQSNQVRSCTYQNLQGWVRTGYVRLVSGISARSSTRGRVRSQIVTITEFRSYEWISIIFNGVSGVYVLEVLFDMDERTNMLLIHKTDLSYRLGNWRQWIVY
jgi:hypothetical protein